MQDENLRLNEGETKINGLERLDPNDREYFLASRVIGEAYFQIIRSLTKNSEPKIPEGLPEDARKIFNGILQALKISQIRQDKIYKDKGWQAFDFLKSILPEEKHSLLQKNLDKYKIIRYNQGLFALIIDPEVYQKFFGARSAQAMAVKIQDGISFIIIPAFDSQQDDPHGYQARHLEENIPHETNHVISFFAERERAVECSEQNRELRKGFLLYREELLCRLCSGGTIGGYDHVRLNEGSQRSLLSEQEPETLAQLDLMHTTLLNLCGKISATYQDSSVKKTDIIYSVMRAKNYSELIENLERIKKIIDQTTTVREQELIDGTVWSFV